MVVEGNFLAVGLLGIHIIGGTIALLSAAIAVATKKGGTQHRRFGKWYAVYPRSVALCSRAKKHTVILFEEPSSLSIETENNKRGRVFLNLTTTKQ